MMSMKHKSTTPHLPSGVLELIFSFITSNSDRNSLSLVCKTWFLSERLCRKRVIISNCCALSPNRLITRFPHLAALSLKGRPRFSYKDMVPSDLGGTPDLWIDALAKSCPLLQELHLKRMVVSDNCLQLISLSFPNFKSLVLADCEGFSNDGLAAIAANCRFLEVLDLFASKVLIGREDWLSYFPESSTSLVSLSFACFIGPVNPVSLLRLVTRCRKLKTLRLNKTVTFGTLYKILAKAPQIENLGADDFGLPLSVHYPRMCSAIRNCKSLKVLSGFWAVNPKCLPILYPICHNLISLNLSCKFHINGNDLAVLISRCINLQNLWVSDIIGASGLELVASSCKNLEELRIVPGQTGVIYGPTTDKVLVAISMSCPKLHTLDFYCHQMSNAGLIFLAKSCPNLISFKLHVLYPKIPDHLTSDPFDEGIGDIVRCCKKLKRLSLSGLLTDQVFLYIGMYGDKLESLSVSDVGDSSEAIVYVLNGCENLRKLKIRNCPFGDATFLGKAWKFDALQCLWMSNCKVTVSGCSKISSKVPSFNVELIDEKNNRQEAIDASHKADKVYFYRALDGPRKDPPDYVWTL